MPIGKIVNAPQDSATFARVRDEYGNEYSVHKAELPEEAQEGDDFAYRVDVFQHQSSLATTLKKAYGI